MLCGMSHSCRCMAFLIGLPCNIAPHVASRPSLRPQPSLHLGPHLKTRQVPAQLEDPLQQAVKVSIMFRISRLPAIRLLNRNPSTKGILRLPTSLRHTFTHIGERRGPLLRHAKHLIGTQKGRIRQTAVSMSTGIETRIPLDLDRHQLHRQI